MIGNRGGDSRYNDHWLSNFTIRLYTLNKPVFSDTGRVIGMGKRNKSTPPLIVDTIHTMKTMIKVFLPTLQPNMFSDTFVQLRPHSYGLNSLLCFAYATKKSMEFIIWTLENQGIQSMIMDNFSPSSNLGTGALSLPKKTEIQNEDWWSATQWMGGEFIYFHDFLCTPKKFNLCMCFPVRTIFVHILLVIWSKLRCRRTSSDGFKYSNIPYIVRVQCSSCLTCHENVGWFMC